MSESPVRIKGGELFQQLGIEGLRDKRQSVHKLYAG
jgi:hypothetical protein